MGYGPDLVWIFSSGRSGTTWLMRLVAGSLEVPQWNEPRVGRMLNTFVKKEGWRSAGEHLLAAPSRPAFLAGIGAFMQAAAHEKFGDVERVVVKEPNGSSAGALLAEALPSSRVILVMRDLRDVVASSFDGKQPGSWQNSGGKKWADVDPLDFTRELTRNAVHDMQGAIDAYDAHSGSRALVRYEDLVADTPSALGRMFTDLEIPYEPTKVRATADRLAFDSVADDKRGPGKFYRKASPGSWHEDLTPDQIAIVEQRAKPILERFYGSASDRDGRMDTSQVAEPAQS